MSMRTEDVEPESANSAGQPRARLPWWAKLCVGLVLVSSFGGFFHVVYGAGLKVCAKDGWALEDTFVDLDDYVGHPLISLLPKAKVVRALIACEVLQRPAILDREDK